MTDRINGLFVALEKDIREDDVEELVQAIRQFRGVTAVSTNVVNMDGWIAYSRAKNELREKLFQVLMPMDRTDL